MVTITHFCILLELNKIKIKFCEKVMDMNDEEWKGRDRPKKRWIEYVRNEMKKKRD